MEINEILEEVGLNEKEARIYLALLNLGEATASRVSEISDINRITTYVILKALKEKGFCSVYDKNKIQYFKPIKPEQILGLLEEKKKKVSAILPLLKRKENLIQDKPELSIFEGKKGITSMLDLILKDAEKTKEVFAYGNLTITEKLIEYQSLFWRKTRLEKGIKISGVLDSIQDFEPRKEEKWKKLSHIKVLKEISKINSYVLITSNLVGYLSFKGELIGIVIRNKDIAEKEKFNFDLLWEKAK
jgi:sugar-specific transcriptional regulator TrmB